MCSPSSTDLTFRKLTPKFQSRPPALASSLACGRPSHPVLHRRCSVVPFLRARDPSRSLRSFVRPKIVSLAMEASEVISTRHISEGIDETMAEQYASQAKLLKEFSNITDFEKAWVFNSSSGGMSRAMFCLGQADLLTDKKRISVLSSHISKNADRTVNFDWSPFPIELQGVSAAAVVPSPSGSKLLIVRNDTPIQLEIWGPSMLQKVIHVPRSVHGTIFTDGWFEGISWNKDESFVAYVAEEPCPSRPAFDNSGFKKDSSPDSECGSWKGQGEYEEHWGETYSEKRRPGLFVLDIESGEVRVVNGISKLLSVGQVVWAPSSTESYQDLVFVGWPSDIGPNNSLRKLGMKYCYNRPCSLYAVRSPFPKPTSDDSHASNINANEDSKGAINLTPGISSAFFPRFSPDGASLVFLSAKSAVDSGVHSATDSLHRINWIVGGKPCPSSHILDVVPVVMSAGDGSFPGLYCSRFMSYPWLSDGCTLILCSYWGSLQVIVSVNVLSGKVTRLTPKEPVYSWNVLALDGDNILAVSSSPIDPPQVKYGYSFHTKEQDDSGLSWEWLDVASPLTGYPEKVKSLLSSLQFDILKIPVRESPENLTEGSRNPMEAIFVSSKVAQTEAYNDEEPNVLSPLIVVLHGGPHSLSLASYSKSLAFLAALGYSLLMVNYRGSLGFGEEALQSLPGKIGSQDVNDVLTAMDYVSDMGLVDPSRVAVVGGSHGGFLTTHLIGQAPDRFKVAAARNPVCNLSIMVGTTDIPDWCYVEAYGSEGKNFFTEAASAEHLQLFYSKSPIAHLSKVKVPVLFLLGAQDLRVPASNGFQYARTLKAKGGEVKIVIFPNDIHGLERPQADFESYLNIGVWFRKYCN